MKFLAFSFLALFLIVLAAVVSKLSNSILEALLDPYEYSNVRISPSGKYLSLIQTEGEINTLVVLDMASMKPLTSVKYGEKGKTKKLNVCCTRWINDELLSYGATRKSSAPSRAKVEHRICSSCCITGSRNDQIWTAYGNYERTRRSGGKAKGFLLAWNQIFWKTTTITLCFSILSWEARPSLARMSLSNGDMKSIRRLPEKTMSAMSTRVTKSPSAADIDLLVSVAARGKEFLIGEKRIFTFG